MLIFKFQIVHGHNVPVLNAHLLQPVKQPALAQHLVKIHPAFIVGEIDVGHEPLQPRPLHQPGVVLHMDSKRLGGVHLRRPGHILRLIHHHRRQLREHPANGLYQLPGPLVGSCGHLQEGVARLLHMLF